MKLYTLHGIKFYDDDKITAKPATPAEVVAAHPKCGTCGHKWTHDVQYYGMIGYEFPITVHDCTYENNPKTLGFRPKRIDPALDYCRHHSELNKENDDDKPE